MDSTDGYLYNSSMESEKLGDKESTHTIELIALWNPINYVINVDLNKGSGSTTPYLYNASENQYISSPIVNIYSITVEFDTNDWIWTRNDSGTVTTGFIDEVVVGRFGYEFTGWYTRRVCDVDLCDHANCSDVIYNYVADSDLTLISNSIYGLFENIRNFTDGI